MPLFNVQWGTREGRWRGASTRLLLSGYSLFNGPVQFPKWEESFLVFCFTENTREGLRKTKIIMSFRKIKRILEILFFKIMYFWLCWVFTASLRLSLVVERNGSYSLVVVRWLLIALASLVSQHGLSLCVDFSSCGSWA